MRHASICLAWSSRSKAPVVHSKALLSRRTLNDNRAFGESVALLRKPRASDMAEEYASTKEDSPESATHLEHLKRPDNSSRQTEQKGQSKKRDTHFLCFPLVTETSIPQLAKSLHYFRDVTTKPSYGRKSQSSENQTTEFNEPESNETVQSGPTTIDEDRNSIEPNTNLNQKLERANPDLQILPAIAHRPPGTFHLTLGVMDLSEKGEMERALELLQGLDYAAILRDVLAQSEESKHPRETLHRTDLSPGQATEDGSALASLKRPVSPPTTGTIQKHKTDLSKDNLPSISLTGLSTFPSAKASRVFYAKPSPSPTSPFPLLQFGQAIRRKFREARFITETRPLVLHATVANMRYAVQARGGRTSKGKSWRYGKDRWKDGEVDARELIKCFDDHGGNVEEYTKGRITSDGDAHEFIWAKNIVINRVAICKMGAEKSDDEILGAVYPPVGEKIVFT